MRMSTHSVKPMKPTDVLDLKAQIIPEHMIQAVNELIAIKWDGNKASIRKDELLERYFRLVNIPNDRASQEELEGTCAMDFQDVYRREGWTVEYHKPDINEPDFEPFYKFYVKENKQVL